jgi:hypothetical protein
MKQSYRSILVLTATITAVSLYAFLGPDPHEKEAEKQLGAVVATASIKKQDAVMDHSTGLSLLKNGNNELVFTSDIQEAVASKLMEQLVAAGFFNASSTHKMILGREPNNYIIFYSQNNRESESSATLKTLLGQLSASVFNHQPVVIKVINEQKEILQVII